MNVPVHECQNGGIFGNVKRNMTRKPESFSGRFLDMRSNVVDTVTCRDDEISAKKSGTMNN